MVTLLLTLYQMTISHIVWCQTRNELQLYLKLLIWFSFAFFDYADWRHQAPLLSAAPSAAAACYLHFTTAAHQPDADQALIAPHAVSTCSSATSCFALALHFG